MIVFNWYLWSCGVWWRQNRYVCAVGPSFNYQQTGSLWKPPHAFTCHISKGKGEVVLVHAMKPNWQVDKHIHSFLVLPLHSICFIPSTHWTGWYVGQSTCLNTLEERKISWSCQELSQYSSVVQPVAFSLHKLSYASSLCQMGKIFKWQHVINNAGKRNQKSECMTTDRCIVHQFVTCQVLNGAFKSSY